jgi:4-hydroxybenzoate polyprenyltransferase
MLVFSVFLFFSLAIVKRCSELVSLKSAGRTGASGRDYQVGDLSVLWPLGVGASLSALVVFCLFISAPQTVARYASPELLWLGGVGLLYWISRLWIKTARGEMHDDPIVFAIKDRGSVISVLGVIAITIAAYLLDLPGL